MGYKAAVVSLLNSKKRKYFKNSHRYWYEEAIAYSEKAGVYDPHKKVLKSTNKVIDNLNGVNKITSIIKHISLISFAIGIIQYPIVPIFNEEILISILLAIFILNIYQSILWLDTETIQTTNLLVIKGISKKSLSFNRKGISSSTQALYPNVY